MARQSPAGEPARLSNPSGVAGPSWALGLGRGATSVEVTRAGRVGKLRTGIDTHRI
jgi:hypothetical protein